MGDYISLEAANELCRECVRKYPNSFYNGIEAVRSELRNIPDAAVRPVVTCGECIHRHDPRRQMCTGRKPDFFCADGERGNDDA